uniref:Uncharacterized protein n=1 Tax=Siphoviridae sp. ctDmR33 TaxID=2825389 RepID=A0A8S5UX47_9CAUD|nr:MAG TPA: hypothetical protein [Siphoviridae sp. ctDmR33]
MAKIERIKKAAKAKNIPEKSVAFVLGFFRAGALTYDDVIAWIEKF